MTVIKGNYLSGPNITRDESVSIDYSSDTFTGRVALIDNRINKDAGSGSSGDSWLNFPHFVDTGVISPDGYWDKGQIIYSNDPAATGAIGWICTSSGVKDGETPTAARPLPVWSKFGALI
jgi:hypothetical protein